MFTVYVRWSCYGNLTICVFGDIIQVFTYIERCKERDKKCLILLKGGDKSYEY